MFNRGMLRGNWSSIRGAAPVGLGALGRHDARLQGLAGWLASSLAHTLCMFSPLCQLVTMSDVSLVRELRARGRRLMERTRQLLLASESGVTLSAIHYWQRWAILVIVDILNLNSNAGEHIPWAEGEGHQILPPSLSSGADQILPKGTNAKYLQQYLQQLYWLHVLQITEKLQETLRMYDQC